MLLCWTGRRGRRELLIILLAALPLGSALGQTASLRGEWSLSSPTMPTYMGKVMIDAENRVTVDAPVDGGRPARFHGYVSRADGPEIEFTLTNRNDVVRTACAVESADLMRCRSFFKDGSAGAVVFLVRSGQGPQRARPVLP